MAGRVLSGGSNSKALTTVQTPTSIQEKVLQGSFFGGFEGAREQRDYLELLKLKSQIKAQGADLGPDADILRSLAGNRSAEESLFIQLYSRMTKISDMDPRMLQLRQVYGSSLSKMALCKQLAEKLVQKRHAEQALYSVLGLTDKQYEDMSRSAYNVSMEQSATNLVGNQIVDPSRAFGYETADLMNADRTAGVAARRGFTLIPDGGVGGGGA
jgi:hypothetical protein